MAVWVRFGVQLGLRQTQALINTTSAFTKSSKLLDKVINSYYSVPVSAEGRVEYQKLNQTAALLSLG